VSSGYRVRIVLSGNQQRAHVELRSAADSRLESRDVAFLARDPHEDRWRSLGVVAAALVVLEETRSSGASPPLSTRAVSLPTPALVPALEVAAGASNHSVKPPPTPVGSLTLAATYWPLHFVGMVGVRYGRSVRSADPTSQWLGVNAGFGTRMGSRAGFVGLDLRALAEWQRVLVSAEDAAAARSEHLQTSRFGMRVSLQPSFRLSPRLALIAAAEVAVIRPEVLIDVRDEPADRLPAVSGGALIGLRIHL
jgi:hypothetical protein